MNKSFLLGIITLIALYLGTGGFIILQNDQIYIKPNVNSRDSDNLRDTVYFKKKQVISKNINYDNKEVLYVAEQQGLILKIYPYADKIPSILCFILTAISFGIIGSVGKVINDSIQNKNELNNAPNLLLIPIQGGFIGLIIIGISYVIPIILTNDSVSLKPVTIVFLSLFGGIFYLNFYNWLMSLINKKIFEDDKH